MHKLYLRANIYIHVYIIDIDIDLFISSYYVQMRDALIDTILEKQSETNVAMRNVRENLEVMSRTGDGPTGGGSGGQFSSAGGGRGGSSMSSKNNSNMSTKMNGPASSGGGVPSSAAASSAFAPSAQSKKAGVGALRQQGSAAGSGIRASISSVDSFGFEDAGGDSFDCNGSLTSSQTGGGEMNVAVMQKSSVAAFQRPSMVGQELRGTAPPVIARQSSSQNMLTPLSRQPSMVAPNNRESPINLASPAQQATQRTSNAFSPPTKPQQQQQQQQPQENVYDRTSSPEPNEFSRTVPACDSEPPSPRASSAPTKTPQPPQVAFQQQTPVTTTTATYGSQHQQQPQQQLLSAPKTAPSQQGQVRYVAPPENSQPRYQGQSYQAPQAGIMDHVHPEDALYVPQEYAHFQQAQFLADICLNFEEISVKRKRVANVPTVMCESIADITQDIAEFMARSADYEMVQYTLSSVAGLTSAHDISYDENLVLPKRNNKIEEYLNSVTNLIILTTRGQQPGMVRLDARSLFLSLIKKSLDMFMSKHNQVREGLLMDFNVFVVLINWVLLSLYY